MVTVSFDVETLFSKVRIQRTNEQFSNKFMLTSELGKCKEAFNQKTFRDMQKTAFTLNGVISEQREETVLVWNTA